MKVGIDVLLTLVLAVLKLTGVLNVSWFVVFLPVIITTMLVVAVFTFIGVVAAKGIKQGHITIKGDK